jgi:putative addiction module component (TIGR02574 family)
MNPATEQVFRAALALPEDEQRELVEALLSARPADKEIEAAWDAEAERRLDEILSRQSDGQPLDEFLAELRGRRP